METTILTTTTSGYIHYVIRTFGKDEHDVRTTIEQLFNMYVDDKEHSLRADLSVTTDRSFESDETSYVGRVRFSVVIKNAS